MSYKKSTYISLIGIILFGIIYFYSINSMNTGLNTSLIGPKYFPNLLVGLLIILCIISFIQTMKKPDKKIDYENTKLILATIGITMIFFAAWYYTKLFYIVVFLYMASLFILYKPERNVKSILISLIISLVLTLFLYVVFGRLMYVRF